MAQHVLISGASSGIGKAAAESLARNGITIFAGALNDAEAQAMRAEGIKGIVPVVLDVTRMESIDAAIAQIKTTIGDDGYLHGLVNCAGVDFNAPLHVLERLHAPRCR
jgi:NAD(P)-dependent dehydrogenase (short-subunit alcohol dehydrogenase family)